MAIDTPYRAIFCDLWSDTTLDILPLRDVSFEDYIGRAGSLSGTVPIPDREIAERAHRIRPGRTTVYLERGGDLWWGGIVWTTNLQASDRGVLTLGVQASTFDSYATRRRIRTNEFETQFTQPTDQFVIARSLWRSLSDGLGLSRIDVGDGDEAPGALRTASWRYGDETVYQEALDQLGAQGLEYQIQVYRDPSEGTRVRRLKLGSPIRTGATDMVFDRPGSILSYSIPDDATRGGTTALARGASTNSNAGTESRPTLSDVKVPTKPLPDLWPQLDLSSDHNDISDKSTLNALAQAEVDTPWGSVQIPEISIRLGGIVPPTLLGRTARIRITDEWHPTGLDARYRIVGVKVRPAERGRPDTAELALEEG
ncbi:hypothetical protein GCM10010222_08720 [Streptomyces tanashiensis]|uniref:hypothetical protein n=1 Tax=Streptomyces tanashiensis TaxID=67367 RepID=UPI001678D203|nr:hypothetical protein [Streptomyces tanashiensis]GGS70091.1 hypothetical protein GCM10010222_08720 [Streptomyces tanashiensis]